MSLRNLITVYGSLLRLAFCLWQRGPVPEWGLPGIKDARMQRILLAIETNASKSMHSIFYEMHGIV